MTERLPVEPRSPVYQEFSRLYGIAHAMRPPVRRNGGGWNGELFAHTGAWGSVHPKTGAMSLHHERVLPYLTGTQSMTSPGKQAQALQTVLHEYYHQRVEIDAPREPNAVRSRESKALDEGLTDYQAKKDVDAFADRAGYGDVVSDDHAYRAAYEASAQMLAYAAPDPQRRDLLAQRALDQPVVMRWDAVGDEIVHSRLDGVVPRDPQHQQAARAALVHAMAHPGWQFLEEARQEKARPQRRRPHPGTARCGHRGHRPSLRRPAQ